LDGIVSTVQTSGTPNAVAQLGRVKLVNPGADEIVRGGDGLFRMRNGESAQADATVQLTSGALEGSNVNVVEAMVSMISNARQFDVQMKMLQNAESNARQASTILAAGR